MDHLETANWLARHHTNGYHLGMKELLHYQTRYSLLDLRPGKHIQANLSGAYLAKTKGRGMEFDEARHYQAGDDIRAIDWRVTARTGKTHTKLFREEKERPIFILVDLSPSMHFGTRLLFKSVLAAHMAALIAWAAKARGDKVGGVVFNHSEHREFKPQARQKAVLSFLNGVVGLHQSTASTAPAHDDATGFNQACGRLRRLALPGSLVFIISDFQQLDELSCQHLSQISRHSQLVCYPVSDPFEHDLPQTSMPQQVALANATETKNLLLGEPSLAKDYHQSHARKFAAMFQQLHQSRAQVIPLSAAEPLEQQLIERRKG